MDNLKDNIYCIYLTLPPYLRDWVVNDCGGEQPLRFSKLSNENILLKNKIRRLPANVIPDLKTEGSVAIAIPNFRFKPPQYFNYLPKADKVKLKTIIAERFKIDLWNSLHKAKFIGKRKEYLIEEFMSSHGIEYTDRNLRTIIKIYQRAREDYLKNKKEDNN